MLVDRLLRGAASGEPVPLYGDGRQSRDFTYVDDAVRATLAAATVPARAEVANVGSGVSTTILQMVEHVGHLTGRQVTLRPTGEQAGDVRCTHADLTKAEQLLSYSPRVGLVDGLSRQLTAVRQDQLSGGMAAAEAPAPSSRTETWPSC